MDKYFSNVTDPVDRLIPLQPLPQTYVSRKDVKIVGSHDPDILAARIGVVVQFGQVLFVSRCSPDWTNAQLDSHEISS